MAHSKRHRFGNQPFYARIAQNFLHGGFWYAVGKYFVKRADVAQSDQGVAGEFAVIHAQIPDPRIGHHCLHDADFFIVVVQKRAVAFHAVRTHDGIIDFKLIDKINRRHARNPAVQGTHHAGGDDDGVVGARGRNGGNVNIVGDNPQVFCAA